MRCRSSGSKKAKNSTDATTATKKLGHSTAPSFCTGEGGVGDEVSGSIMVTSDAGPVGRTIGACRFAEAAVKARADLPSA